MGFRIHIRPKTRAQLAAIANPESANQPEALPWVLYDTVAWTTASTTSGTYFGTVQSDKTLGNMEGPGQLPDPQYFEIAYWGCDFLDPVLTAAAPAATTGPIIDIGNFLFGGRATWTFNISNKRVGPFPLTFMHASGGPTGFGYTISGTTNRVEYGNNGVFDGGFCVECLTESIFTQAGSWEELRKKVKMQSLPVTPTARMKRPRDLSGADRRLP